MSIELIQGDCLEKMQDIPDKSIDFILTDPPYGTTACSWDTIIPLEPMWKQVKRVIKDNGAIALFGNQPFTSILITSNLKMYRHNWVWNKELTGSPQNRLIRPLPIFEDILIFGREKVNYYPIMQKKELKNIRPLDKENRKSECYKGMKGADKGKDHHISGEKYPTNEIKISRTADELNPLAGRFHPTQKPVKLLDYLIRTYTNENETVLDFTMGSGSTGCACIETNRNFIGIELDENYFKIATDRIDKAKQSPKLFY